MVNAAFSEPFSIISPITLPTLFRKISRGFPNTVATTTYRSFSIRNAMNENGITIFSGATPTLFRHAMSCDTTPLSMMEHVLSKYDHIRA